MYRFYSILFLKKAYYAVCWFPFLRRSRLVPSSSEEGNSILFCVDCNGICPFFTCGEAVRSSNGMSCSCCCGKDRLRWLSWFALIPSSTTQNILRGGIHHFQLISLWGGISYATFFFGSDDRIHRSFINFLIESTFLGDIFHIQYLVNVAGTKRDLQTKRHQLKVQFFFSKKPYITTYLLCMNYTQSREKPRVMHIGIVCSCFTFLRIKQSRCTVVVGENLARWYKLRTCCVDWRSRKREREREREDCCRLPDQTCECVRLVDERPQREKETQDVFRALGWTHDWTISLSPPF